MGVMRRRPMTRLHEQHGLVLPALDLAAATALPTFPARRRWT